MSFFDGEAFIEASRSTWPELRGARPDLVEVNGRRYRVLVSPRGRPLTTFPFLDIVEPLDETRPVDPDAPSSTIEHGDARPVSHLDNVRLATLTVEEFTEQQARRGLAEHDQVPRSSGATAVAPRIVFGPDTDPATFEREARRRSKNAFRQSRRAASRVVEHLGGPARVRLDDDDDDHFEQILRWKQEQYLATGFTDLIDAGGDRFFRALRDRGATTTSTLSVGERLIAGHIGVRHDGVFHYWMPSYDAAAAPAAPGLLLLERLIEASIGAGDRIFDFLEGQEQYKFYYATHVRLIGTVGTPPPLLRWYRTSRIALSERLDDDALLRRAVRTTRSFRRR